MRPLNIVSLLILFNINLIAQVKFCIPDTLQYKIYTDQEINGKDTTFTYPTSINIDYEKYNYRDCLSRYTISKIRQVFRGEIDYLPQELKSSRESYYLASDTPKRVLRIKQKYLKDSLTTEMAIDTLIKESSMKNINFNINRSLRLPRTKLILTIGQIYLKEMIPDLEWALSQDSTIFPPLQVKLALARLGIKMYQDYFMDYYKGFVRESGQSQYIQLANNIQEINGFQGKTQVLTYINTEESWDLLLQENLNHNILKICLSGCEYITYHKEFVHHPKFPFKNLEEEDQKRYQELFLGGPQKACYSMDSPEKVWETCPKEAGIFLYNLHQKYVKNYVMPYDYFEK